MNKNGVLDPIYVPSPYRKLPKPIGFELNFNSKIDLPANLEKRAPPGLESTKDQLEWRKKRIDSTINNKPIINLPDRSFPRNPKNKLKIYQQENISKGSSSFKPQLPREMKPKSFGFESTPPRSNGTPSTKNKWIKTNARPKKYKNRMARKSPKRWVNRPKRRGRNKRIPKSTNI